MTDASSPSDPAAELARLRAENERLRALVGPSEESYEKLSRDALGARQAAMQAEFDAGRARARVVELENEVRRWQRDFVWFRDGVVRRVPFAQRLVARLPDPKAVLRPIVARVRPLLARLR